MLSEILSQGISGGEASHNSEAIYQRRRSLCLGGYAIRPVHRSCLDQSKQSVDVERHYVRQIHLKDVLGPLTTTKAQKVHQSFNGWTLAKSVRSELPRRHEAVIEPL
jgi:hypothetical protein